MAIRSFTGYLNTDLFGSTAPGTNDTFDLSTLDRLTVLLSDGDLNAEGDTSGGNTNTEQSQDPEGDQIAFVATEDGEVLIDGSEFYLELTFVFEINGQQFTGYHFEQEGGGGLDFTIFPPDLPSGTAEVISIDFTPTPDTVPYASLSSGDEVVSDQPFGALDLSGTDEIISGSGDDTIYAGIGDDIIDAGAGNDTIYGDSSPAGTDYSAIPDPSGNGTAIDDGDDLSGGVVLTSGGVQVTLDFNDDGNATGFEYNDSDTQYTEGLNSGQGGSDNAILLGGTGAGSTSTTTISFASVDAAVEGEVTGVNFRINDIDDAGWRDIVTVRAFDADGNPVEVTLTGGSNMTLSDTDGVAGNDTVTAIDGSGNQTPGTAASSLLVEVAGPVATIEVEYGNLESDGQRIDLTEIFFEPILVAGAADYDDTIDAGAGDDTIFGELGDDTIDGGAGVDSIDAGAGDDTIAISEGSDDISGGEGADTFDAQGGSSLTDETITVTVDNDGDGTIDKANDGSTDTVSSVETYIADEAVAESDTISFTETGLTAADITGLDDSATGVFTPNDGSGPITFGGVGEPTLSDLLGDATPGGTYSITGGDESGQVGNIAFENFENIDFSIVCFANGTRIETAQGPKAIETLGVGDMVVTLDNGLQEIRWIGHKHLEADVLTNKDHLRPIRIKAGALGNDLPQQDLVVSPQHRVLVRSKIAIRMFDAAEVFVPAKLLLGTPGVEIAHDLAEVTYYHIMCDQHEIVRANGALAETLHTGPEALKALGPEAVREITDIFGALPSLERPLARPSAKGKQAKKLVARHVKNNKPLFHSKVN